MLKRVWIVALAALTLVAFGEEELKSGIYKSGFDESVRPQDDFYRYVNGSWLDSTEIPGDKSNYGIFTVLFDESQKNQLKIIEEAAASKDNKVGSDAQKIGDFYQSFMDTVTVEKLGLTPLQADLDKLQNVKSREDLVVYMAYAQKIGIQKPFFLFVNQDMKNSTEYAAYITQSGLGLPDKRYYEDEGEKFTEIREKYLAHIAEMFTLAGIDGGAERAAKIMEMETGMSQAHWSRVESRDRDKTYNKFTLAEMQEKHPNFDWKLYMEAAGVTEGEVIVRQPSFIAAFDSLYGHYSEADWKNYLTWKLLTTSAPLLSKKYVDEDFNFYQKTLRGIQEQQPRWKRAVNGTNNVLGEVVGRIYVARHFKPEAKERMKVLVDNLKLAFADQIKGLEWMSEDTKKQALEKLSKFHTKIGYPDEWKDYSQLEIKRSDLLHNYKRSNIVEYHRMIDKLGNPIDRGEWFMTPQTVNAYYNPPMNEIVFPAAILQPPFFNMEAEDAVNYGAIGAVIGHELTHGFDDQGRKSDGDGNLRDWWTEQDGEEFKKRAQVMIDQYGNYTPIDTMSINGELTLGENIADLGGLTIAYQAYKRSLNGADGPVLDGFTSDQRFFMGWAQSWRRKYRDDELRNRILTDPHSPSKYRVVGVLANMPEFYKAFKVTEEDPMYRSDDVRVKIW